MGNSESSNDDMSVVGTTGDSEGVVTTYKGKGYEWRGMLNKGNKNGKVPEVRERAEIEDVGLKEI